MEGLRKNGGMIIGAFLGALAGGYFSGNLAFGLVFGGAFALARFLEILLFGKNFLFFALFGFGLYLGLISYFDIKIPETIYSVLAIFGSHFAGMIILGILWEALFALFPSKTDSQNTKEDGQ